MSRGNPLIQILAIAVLAVVVVGTPLWSQQAKPIELELKDGKASVQGELTKQDALDVKGRKESYSKAYSVKLEAAVYRIDALSKAFDTYLRLEDDKGNQLALDDDSGPEDSNARLIHRIGKTGTYRVVVTTFNPGRVGPFTLTVARLFVGKQKVALKDGSAHVEGDLTREDDREAKDEKRKGTYYRIHEVEFDADATYRIDLTSSSFDTLLVLNDAAGKQLARDDDGGQGTNSRLTYRATKAGTYQLVATTFDANKIGAFKLDVRKVETIKQGRLVLKDGKVEVEGLLTVDDPPDKVKQLSRCQVFTLDMLADKNYRIDLKTRAFDAYLRLEDPDGKRLAEDDDGGDETDSRIVHRCVKAGAYRIIATHLDPNVFGAFALSVEQFGGGGGGGATTRLALKDGRASVESALTRDDALDPVRKTPCRVFLVEMEANRSYRIDHVSRAFDAYLRLEDPDGKRLAENDDGGDGTNSRIIYRPTKAGAYRIIPTTLNAERIGAFTLSIQTAVAAQVVKGGSKLVLKDNKVEVEGVLTRDDPFDKVRDKSRCQTFTVDMEANATYRIDLMSRAFDAYLRLEDPEGKQLAQDDDGGDGNNSRITHRCTKAGAYRIIATHLNPDVLGAYTLSVAKTVAAKARQLALKDGKASIDSELAPDDPKDASRNSPCKVFQVEFEAGQTYRIDHASRAFDAYLRLEDPNGKTVAQDDDGGDGTNSRILYRVLKAGTYQISATALSGDRFGAFTLTVAKLEGAKPIRIAMKDGKVAVEAVLNKDDARDLTRPSSNTVMKLYHVELEANRSYQIDLTSKAFDAFMRLESSDNKPIATDDDSGGERNSRITFRCFKTGTYQIIATTLGTSFGKAGNDKVGDFALTVQQGARVPEIALKDGQGKIESTLSKDDARDYGSTSQVPSRAYAVKMEVGEVYHIDLSSRKFDAFLRLQGPDGATVAENDDGGDGLDARIVFRCTTPGTYYVVAKTVVNPNKFGAFILTVQQQK